MAEEALAKARAIAARLSSKISPFNFFIVYISLLGFNGINVINLLGGLSGGTDLGKRKFDDGEGASGAGCNTYR